MKLDYFAVSCCDSHREINFARHIGRPISRDSSKLPAEEVFSQFFLSKLVVFVFVSYTTFIVVFVPCFGPQK